MAEGQRGSVRVDACGCGGMWLDRGELDALRGRPSHGTEVAVAAGPGHGGHCPCCSTQRLGRLAQGGLVLAPCPRCRGIWVPAAAAATLRAQPAAASGPSWAAAGFDAFVEFLAHLVLLP